MDNTTVMTTAQALRYFATMLAAYATKGDWAHRAYTLPQVPALAASMLGTYRLLGVAAVAARIGAPELEAPYRALQAGMLEDAAHYAEMGQKVGLRAFLRQEQEVLDLLDRWADSPFIQALKEEDENSEELYVLRNPEGQVGSPALGRLPERYQWTIHNLVAHPASEVAHHLGYTEVGNRWHDATIPAHVPGTGRG